ncbi:hypothetical protein [Micromonospora mirobrigensis]|uniref:Uncharacterized protein n=1 Tax=Micromonospora mirobrigensis TaxID=262898 RepID=A0A1C4X1S1_9ACTN|nr:hypothetical protein [Micromonospora mirobrigensis]SCF02422.1 hypothetical protein GA0070564_102653 [Micromonospora mirobrigensis]
MPTSAPLTDQVVTVCFAPGEDADWFAASEKVNDLLHANGTPARRYHVRHRRFIGWLTRFLSYYLLDAARRLGAVTMAAGGRKSRLDLTATTTKAAHAAALRWIDTNRCPTRVTCCWCHPDRLTINLPGLCGFPGRQRGPARYTVEGWPEIWPALDFKSDHLDSNRHP